MAYKNVQIFVNVGKHQGSQKGRMKERIQLEIVAVGIVLSS